jgi:hypothetical protein
MSAKTTKPLVLVAKSRIFYTSRSRGKHLAEAGDVVDPVDVDMAFFLDAGLIDERAEPVPVEET